jgi:hypothetical protein
LEYMLLANDEADGVRTLQALDLTGFALEATLEGRKAIDLERSVGLRDQRRKWDRLRLELAVGDLDLDAIKAARDPGPAIPTDAELRERGRALGLSVPSTYSERTRAKVRGDIPAVRLPGSAR